MAKAKKSAKEASNIFHNIMKASVTPKVDTSKVDKALNHIYEEIAMVVPDWENYTLLQTNLSGTQLLLEFSHDCPPEKSEQVSKIVKHNADLLGLEIIGL